MQITDIFMTILFYNRFQKCNKDFVPNLSTDFKSILEKLSDIQWDTVAGVTNDGIEFKDEIFVKGESIIQFLKKTLY